MNGGYEYWEDYEVLTVETPENLELKLPLAGFGPRFLALLLDSVLQTVSAMLVIFLVIILAQALTLGLDPEGFGMLILFVIVLGTVFVTVGYFMLFEWLWNGQTPGKRMAGIRVVKRGGLPLTLRDVLLRNLIRLVDYMPSYGFIGLSSFFLSKHQQRLGDLVADTVVVREFMSRLPYSWSGLNAGGDPHATPGMVTPVLKYAIGSYLMRSSRLPVEVRTRLTDELISRLGYAAAGMSLAERDAYLAHVLHIQQGAPS